MQARRPTRAPLHRHVLVPDPRSSLQSRGRVFYLLPGEQRAHSPAPSCAKPGPGGSWEKAIRSRAMSRKLILTKTCRMTLAQKERLRKRRPPWYPRPSRRHQGEIRELSRPAASLSRRRCCQLGGLRGGSPSSPHQSSAICLQTPRDWLPSAPVSLCCQRDVVAQGPSR